MLGLISQELDGVTAAAQRIEAAREQILDLAKSKGKLLQSIVEGGLQNMAEATAALAQARIVNPKSLSIQVKPLPGMPIEMPALGIKLHTCWSITRSIDGNFGWESRASTENPEQKPPTPEELVNYLKTKDLTVGEFNATGVIAGVRRIVEPYTSKWLYFGNQNIHLKMGCTTSDLREKNIGCVFTPNKGFRIYIESYSLGDLGHASDDDMQKALLEGEKCFWENRDARERGLIDVKYGISMNRKGAVNVFTAYDVDDHMEGILEGIRQEDS